MNILEHFLSILFKENCFGCGRDGGLMCKTCVLKIPPPTQVPPNKVIAPFSYHYEPLKKTLWAFKFCGKRAVAPVLAQALYDFLIEELSEKKIFDSFEEPLLVPIPMSSARKRKRGYNHTDILAQELVNIDKGKNFEFGKNILIKNRDTDTQVEMKSRVKRLKNLRGSFLVTDNSVRGRNIILLDDIVTTGATMAEAARVLKKSGARKILKVALAH